MKNVLLHIHREHRGDREPEERMNNGQWIMDKVKLKIDELIDED